MFCGGRQLKYLLCGARTYEPYQIAISGTRRSYTSKPGTSKAVSNSSPDNSWESKLDSMAGKLSSSIDPVKSVEDAEKRQKAIAIRLRRLLHREIDLNNSDARLQDHFGELFLGLNTLTSANLDVVRPNMSEMEREAAVLRESYTEEEILSRFDQVYFHGLATFRFTTAVLKDARVKNIQHFDSVVSGGGALLNWSLADRRFFKLHVANKYWQTGQKDFAKKYIFESFESVWLPQLVSEQLSGGRAKAVIHALVATNALLPPEATNDRLDGIADMAAASAWRSLFMVYCVALSTGQKRLASYVCKVADEPIFEALGSIINISNQYKRELGPLLKMNPSSAWQNEAIKLLQPLARYSPDLQRHLDEITQAHHEHDLVNQNSKPVFE